MEVARNWRMKAQRYRMEGSACRLCGQVSFPPRPVCPVCAASAAAGATPPFALPLDVWRASPVDPVKLQTIPLVSGD